MKRELQLRAIQVLRNVCNCCGDISGAAWQARRLLDAIEADAKAAKEKSPEFDGVTYDPALDKDRLSKQLGRVWSVMKDGEWRTIHEIRSRVSGYYVKGKLASDTESAISARLRDFRKKEFGSYILERRRCHEYAGRYEYRLLSPTREKIR